MTHLDGHTVRLVRKGVTQPGELRCRDVMFHPLTLACIGFVQTIHGEGMPIFEKSMHGDLFVEYNVVLPIEISTQTRRSKSGPALSRPIHNSSLSWLVALHHVFNVTTIC